MCLCAVVVTSVVASPPGAGLPWYMRETAMTPDGRLTFLNKPWWPRAKALAEGQSFTLDLNHDDRYRLGDTLDYWKFAGEIEAFVNDYGCGHLHQTLLDLEKITPPDHPITTP